MAISSLAYKITADTRKFNKELGATRKEINATKRILAETASPAQKLEDGLAGLEALQKKGLLTADQYTAAVDKLNDEMAYTAEVVDDAAVSSGELKGELASQVPILGNFAKGAIGVGAAIAAAREGMQKWRELIGLVTEQLAGLDKGIKTAEKLGIEFNNLKTFELAAGRAGIGVEKLQMGLQRLVRKVGDANRGAAESVKIFNSLGLDFQQLARLSPELQFIALSEAISGLDTQAERLSATVKIYDSEAADMVRLLDLGAEGFAKAGAEAEAMGLHLDEDDQANIAETNDRLGDLKAITDGIKTGFAVELAESFKSIADISKLLGVQLKPGTVGGILGGSVRNFVLGSQGAAVLETVGQAAGSINKRNFADAGKEGADAMLAEIEAAAVDLPMAMKPTATFFSIGLASALTETFDAAQAAKLEMDDLKKKADEFARVQKIGDAITRRNETPLETYKRSLDELKDVYDEGAISTQTFNREQKRLQETLDKAEAKALEKPKKIDQLAQNVGALKGSAEALKFEQRVLNAPRKKEEKLLAMIEKNTRSGSAPVEVREVGVV